MSVFAILTMCLLIGLILGGLYISRLATQKQIEQQELRALLRQRRARLGEIEELFQTLLIYDRNPSLLNALHRVLLNEAEALAEMVPNDATSERDLTYYQELAKSVRQLGDLTDNPEIPISDRQINLIKRHFARTMKLIRLMAARGEMNEFEAPEHIKRLIRNTLMLEVEAYKHQGLTAKHNADYSSAASYFKHAKDLLTHTEILMDDKNQHIRTISRMISGLYSSGYDDEIAPASDNDSQSASDKA